MGENVIEGDNSKKVLGVKYHRVDCPNKDIASPVYSWVFLVDDTMNDIS